MHFAWSWQRGVATLVRKPEVQDHLAAERPASRLIWERIWEQNTVKPARAGAMWRNGPDIRRRLTCTFETWRTWGNTGFVAHNPEVAGGILSRLPTQTAGDLSEAMSMLDGHPFGHARLC